MHRIARESDSISGVRSLRKYYRSRKGMAGWRILHPLRMKQRDLKNPSCRKTSDLRHENASVSSDLKQEKKDLLLTTSLRKAFRLFDLHVGSSER